MNFKWSSVKDGVSVVLHIAKGSAAELRTQLYIAQRIGIINQTTQTELTQECKDISAMLQTLAKYLKTQNNQQLKT